MTEISVLYEDDVIIVVNKPSGLPSQATLDPNRDHCYAAVRRYLEKSRHNPYVGLHHRLDAQTSGAILMTKDESVNASIAEQFQNHTIEKTYCAICTGKFDVAEEFRTLNEPIIINEPIGELPGGRIQKFGVNGKKRKPARTRVVCELIMTLRDGILGVYQCSPETGRTHQIRVHLSAHGLGIVDDTLYAEPLLRSLRSIDPGRMCLHAQSICFEHPITHERMEVCAPRPAEMTAFIHKAAKFIRN